MGLDPRSCGNGSPGRETLKKIDSKGADFSAVALISVTGYTTSLCGDALILAEIVLRITEIVIRRCPSCIRPFKKSTRLEIAKIAEPTGARAAPPSPFLEKQQSSPGRPAQYAGIV